MASKKSEKKYKNNNTSQNGSSITNAFNWFKKSIKNDSDINADKNTEHNDNIKFVWGFVLASISLCIFVALFSHFFTGAEDQKLLSNPELPATNWLGNIGFGIAYWLMDNTFGVASILIPVLLIATGIRIMGTI